MMLGLAESTAMAPTELFGKVSSYQSCVHVVAAEQQFVVFHSPPTGWPTYATLVLPGWKAMAFTRPTTVPYWYALFVVPVASSGCGPHHVQLAVSGSGPRKPFGRS